MLYDISPQDFAHHVRHTTSWQDLGFRCGLEKDDRGCVRNHYKLSMLQQKVTNMRLNIDHFHGHQSPISDDDFRTIVKDSTSIEQVMRKCKMENNNNNNEKVTKGILDLCLDISHLKTRKKYTVSGLLDAIDDETFKILVKDDRTWKDLGIACGYSSGGSQKIICRIEKLGLNTNHYDDRDVVPTDKIFVLDSQYKDSSKIKKRLIRDFDRAYECNACKNANFTKRDGVLIWNDQEITLQLEHINGVNNDNRLENLYFLCPNCNSQTSTYAARNLKKYKAGQTWIEEGKTCHAPISIASLLN